LDGPFGRQEDETIPEGPELRRSADQLSQILVGKHLINAFVGKSGRYVDDEPVGYECFLEDLTRSPMKVVEVNCKGKFMWWTLKQGDTTWYMWCTYGMSGQWSRQETKHSAFEVYFNDGDPRSPFESLHFNDPRHFGTLRFVNSDRDQTNKLKSLGPDMLSAPPDDATFADRFSTRTIKKKTVAEAMMNQSVISGVGNYVKAEALYLSELSPHRLVGSLSTVELQRLRQQIINVLRASYVSGGSTFSTYSNPDGTPGKGTHRFVVYGNDVDPLGNTVIREETLDGRTTHWVREVQK
jgi:formamidopyrimidine-DNA glycosylase